MLAKSNSPTNFYHLDALRATHANHNSYSFKKIQLMQNPTKYIFKTKKETKPPQTYSLALYICQSGILFPLIYI